MNRTRRTAAALAALAFTAPLAVATPANAGIFGGFIRHHSPDAGYDQPIRVLCKGKSTPVLIHEGQTSDQRCASKDVQKVFVRTNEQIACYDSYRGYGWWVVTWDRTGWHNVRNWWSKTCVTQRD